MRLLNGEMAVHVDVHLYLDARAHVVGEDSFNPRTPSTASAFMTIRFTSSGGGASPMRILDVRPAHAESRADDPKANENRHHGIQHGQPEVGSYDADEHRGRDEHVVAMVHRRGRDGRAARFLRDETSIHVHAELDDHDHDDEDDGENPLLDLLAVDEPGYRLRDDLEADDAREYGHDETREGLGALVTEGMVGIGGAVGARTLMSTMVDATMSVSELKESEIMAMELNIVPMTILAQKRIMFATIPSHMANFSDRPIVFGFMTFSKVHSPGKKKKGGVAAPSPHAPVTLRMAPSARSFFLHVAFERLFAFVLPELPIQAPAVAPPAWSG